MAGPAEPADAPPQFGPAGAPAPGLPAPLVEALTDAQRYGFLGPAPVAAHAAHAAGFAMAASASGLVQATGSSDSPRPTPGDGLRVLDLGSGGGLPGLVLAALWPDAFFVLLDAMERRTAFLQRAAAACGWERRVVVRRARAEEAARDPELREAFDLVVARGFGPPPVTAECAAAFLAPGAVLIVSEPPSDSGDETGRWPAEPLASLSLRPDGRAGPGRAYQVLRRVGPCSPDVPRRTGVPAKRPLWRVPEEPPGHC